MILYFVPIMTKKERKKKCSEAIKGKVERFKVAGKNVFFFSLIYKIKKLKKKKRSSSQLVHTKREWKEI